MNNPRSEKYLYQLLSHISYGNLTVVDHRGQKHDFGVPATQPHVSVTIKDARLYDKLFSMGSIGLGESYMDGWWDVEADNLVGLLGILMRSSMSAKARRDYGLLFNILLHNLRTSPNKLSNRLRNVSYHYDLGNDFYRLFLDSSLTYTCGLQLADDDTLLQMQLQKYDFICQKLALRPGEEVLDIGCGWGGFLIYAAKRYGIKGKGVTLSAEQAGLAQQRIEALGLTDQIKIEIKDYQQVQESFDKIVSIGMFEHVGKRNFAVFAKKVNSLLRDKGLFLLHTIGTVSIIRNDPWVIRYIFPGGFLPRHEEFAKAIHKASMTVVQIDNLKPHYATTLQKWLETFRENGQKIYALSPSYDKKFMRMWSYYLQSCQAGFRFNNLQLYQILACKNESYPVSRPIHLDLATVARNARDSIHLFSEFV
ncbi:MAG: class I SAM-dependent methyltransferase [Alphaproteobacteria bacterium]|nr:class I SAM-dependent methyltransferase [Alphaproteobacteria bacterium]